MRGRRRTRRTRIRAALPAAAAAAVAIVVLAATGVLDRADLDTVDLRFSIRGEQAAPSDMVVVGIDDETFERLGEQWPFPRSLHADAIDRLDGAGARAIVYDVQFTEETDPDEDRALLNAVGRADNVVLATTEVGERGETNVLGGERNLRPAGAVAANAGFRPGPRGTIRRVPHSLDGLRSIAVEAAERAYGVRSDPGEFGEDGALIDFHGGPGTISYVSFWRVVEGRLGPVDFADKVVLVGAVAPSLQDVHPTSVSGGELMPGVEIQAHATSTVRRGLPLRDGGWVLDGALVVVLAAATALAAAGLRPLGGIAAAVAIMAAFVVVAQLAFNSGTVVSVAYPITGGALAAFGTLAGSLGVEIRERRRTRDLFSRFVPEAVVGQVLEAAGGEARLTAVRRHGTILFCDLRGFSSFAERVPAERVIDALNRYLTEMSEAILDHGGTLVSYMGDGIMAAFGAPIEQPDHADRALAASREMLGERLPRFNAWLEGNGDHDGFRMGIGICSGEVMSGTVGSSRRVEYAAVGDTTNIAARLEAATKESPTDILIADSTRRALTRPAPALEPFGEVAIHGREHGVRAWRLAEPK